MMRQTALAVVNEIFFLFLQKSYANDRLKFPNRPTRKGDSA